MNLKRQLLLFGFSLFICTVSNAQIEVAHLASKNFSAIGLGGFLNVAVPVTEGNSVTGEVGFYSFKQDEDHIALAPLLLGYRYSLDGSGTGFYVEPMAGYTIGATDIQNTGADGKYVEQTAKGVTAGVASGYIFPGSFAFNLGLRYQRVFVSKDPSQNILSLRLSHSISFRKRED